MAVRKVVAVSGAALALALLVSWARADSHTCLSIERPWSGPIALWVNRCDVGIHVMWHDEDWCKSEPGKKYQCSSYVAPNAKSGATLEGRIGWYECKSPRGLGDVVPIERADGSTYCWGELNPRERADFVRRQEKRYKDVQQLRRREERRRRAQERREAHRAAGPCSSELSPACHKKNQLAIDVLSEVQPHLQDSASTTYCAYWMGIEVNYFCAGRYREIGRADCADLSERQAQLYEDALPQLRAQLSPLKSNKIRRLCSLD